MQEYIVHYEPLNWAEILFVSCLWRLKMNETSHTEAWPLYAVNFLYDYISTVIHQNVCWILQLFQQTWLWFIPRSQAWAWLSESLLIQDCSSVRLGEKLGIHTRWASEGIVGSSPYRILKLSSSLGVCFLVNTWNHTLKSVRNGHNRITLIAKEYVEVKWMDFMIYNYYLLSHTDT